MALKSENKTSLFQLAVDVVIIVVHVYYYVSMFSLFANLNWFFCHTHTHHATYMYHTISIWFSSVDVCLCVMCVVLFSQRRKYMGSLFLLCIHECADDLVDARVCVLCIYACITIRLPLNDVSHGVWIKWINICKCSGICVHFVKAKQFFLFTQFCHPLLHSF